MSRIKGILYCQIMAWAMVSNDCSCDSPVNDVLGIKIGLAIMIVIK